MQQYLEARQTPSPSCWFWAEQNKVDLPLVDVNYNIKITNNFCSIKLKHKYVNPLDKPLDINFSYPIDTNFCLGKLEATFNGYTVGGIVK